MKKEMTYTELAKETAILTAAVAIIATAVYFFLVPSHASVSSIWREDGLHQCGAAGVSGNF